MHWTQHLPGPVPPNMVDYLALMALAAEGVAFCKSHEARLSRMRPAQEAGIVALRQSRAQFRKQIVGIEYVMQRWALALFGEQTLRAAKLKAKGAT